MKITFLGVPKSVPAPAASTGLPVRNFLSPAKDRGRSGPFLTTP